MGALRGLPLAEGRRRGRELLEEHGLGYAADRQIRQLSKGMAQQVQLLGTLVHEPRLVVLDEPFSGLDAINQGKLERLIRALAAEGHHGDLLDPRDRPCRAAVRSGGDHRRRQGALRRLGRRRARPHPAQVRLETARRRRPVARGAARRRPARGQLLALPAARERDRAAAARADRGRRGHPLAVDRARRAARCVRRHRRRGGRAGARSRNRGGAGHERTTEPSRLPLLAGRLGRWRGAISPRSCSAARSSSSCSARCSRWWSARWPAAIGQRVESAASRRQIGIAMAAGRRRRDARARASGWRASSAERCPRMVVLRGSTPARRSIPRAVLETARGQPRRGAHRHARRAAADRHRRAASSGGAAPVALIAADAAQGRAQRLSRGRAAARSPPAARARRAAACAPRRPAQLTAVPADDAARRHGAVQPGRGEGQQDHRDPRRGDPDGRGVPRQAVRDAGGLAGRDRGVGR